LPQISALPDAILAAINSYLRTHPDKTLEQIQPPLMRPCWRSPSTCGSGTVAETSEAYNSLPVLRGVFYRCIFSEAEQRLKHECE
jgi:hypothetical protein